MNTKNKYGIRSLERRYGRLTFSKFLVSWRKSENLSQIEFAKKLGISKANLCDIEKGRKHVSPERAAKIARKLDLPEDFLIQIALQDVLRDAKLNFKIEIKKAA